MFCTVLPRSAANRENDVVHKNMKEMLIIMSLFSLLFGCRKQESSPPAESPPSAVKSAQGWICVHKGTPELARAAINAYADNFKKVTPREFRVNIVEHQAGFLVVTFPDGISPYDFVNLIGWLNQPPETKGVSGTAGWITSPASGLRYALQPESGNQWSDTLVGTSSDGKAVQVYQPGATMCEISRNVAVLPEPDISSLPAGSGITFSVTLDVDPSFGNPEFKITHPKDTNWNK